jgi:hypothetical protein
MGTSDIFCWIETEPALRLISGLEELNLIHALEISRSVVVIMRKIADVCLFDGDVYP